MARYTIQLKDVCNLVGYDEVLSWFKSYDIATYLTQDEIKVINERGTWNPERLAQKIVSHYATYEIGYETPALFKHMVMNEMNELMEEYLPLIYSASIKFDPLVNVDFTEEFHQEESGKSKNTGSSQSNGTSSGSALAINSDTPQGQIDKKSILAGDYATSTVANENSSKNNDKTDTETNTDTSSLNDYVKRTKGNSGVSATAQALILQYRDTIRAIDREIIEKLNPHFMGIF